MSLKMQQETKNEGVSLLDTESAFYQIMISDLKDQIEILELTYNPDMPKEVKTLVKSLHRVIAYNSVPMSYKDGKYDIEA